MLHSKGLESHNRQKYLAIYHSQNSQYLFYYVKIQLNLTSENYFPKKFNKPFSKGHWHLIDKTITEIKAIEN